ncbi:hypothetical protein [Methylobacterium sp. J-090]|uniref:hypothetical protein n=1 Tax=Methylobacterium sp. J-090 TaxID=2836666 RepID=UPI001FB8B9EF|nr:hypothetical protein [Methylobacterium sp. J-090]MCJ2084204.1 hypothetical protein [Methylobacterium sp. J-090]
MATCWDKSAYTAADRDPLTHEILPGAMPPGIYCEDEAGYRALLKGAREKGQVVQPTFSGVSLGGTSVYVATPAQAEMLRGIAEAPAEPDAFQQASAAGFLAIQAMLGRISEKLAAEVTSRSRKVTPYPLRIPTQMNRAAQRAAASRRS